jgi:hypothetical protein
MTTSKMISQNVGGVTDDCRIIVGRMHPFLLVVVVGRSVEGSTRGYSLHVYPKSQIKEI